jgi:ATP phosphoribosyltransferase
MSNLKLGIQKSGRLSEKSLEIISKCGIKYSNSTNKLVTVCDNFPLEILFLRDDDISGYVADGVIDIGIVGENTLVEGQHKVSLNKRLGFSRCRLSLAVPKNFEYTSLKDLQGKSLATSYPVILKNYLDKNGVSADIHLITGSVEIAPSIGLADAICDIVSTGSTLISNGLKEVETIFKSEAVLISNSQLSPDKSVILDKLLFRIESVQHALNHKYIILNCPDSSIEAIKNILPGIKSPTVTPLADEGWSSISSVINENEFWEKIEQIKSVGAQGILVMPIEKMIY